MRFFEITYIPKGQKAFELVGDILTDQRLVNEINADVGQHGLFLANLEVVESNKPGEKHYAAKASGHRKALLGRTSLAADIDIKVLSGDRHDSIVVSGDADHKDVGALIASKIRTTILPKMGPFERPIVVRSF